MWKFEPMAGLSLRAKGAVTEEQGDDRRGNISPTIFVLCEVLLENHGALGGELVVAVEVC